MGANNYTYFLFLYSVGICDVGADLNSSEVDENERPENDVNYSTC